MLVLLPLDVVDFSKLKLLTPGILSKTNENCLSVNDFIILIGSYVISTALLATNNDFSLCKNSIGFPIFSSRDNLISVVSTA
jgi:hypothetical protein